MVNHENLKNSFESIDLYKRGNITSSELKHAVSYCCSSESNAHELYVERTFWPYVLEEGEQIFNGEIDFE